MLALGPCQRVLEAVAQERAVREAGQRIVHRFVAHALLVAKARERGGERVRDRAHEAQLLLLEGSRRSYEQLIAGADGKPQPGLRVRPVRRERGPAGEPHLRGRDGKQLPQPFDRLERDVRGIGAGERAFAHRRDRPQARLGGALLRDVTTDREEQLAGGRLDDSPAHLADELRPVATQAPRRGRESERMLGGEVELHVALVALADALRPQHVDGLSEQLLAGVAEQLLGERIHEHDPAVARRGDHRVRQPLEHRRRRDQQRVKRRVLLGAPLRSIVYLFVHDPAFSVQRRPSGLWPYRQAFEKLNAPRSMAGGRPVNHCATASPIAGECLNP